MTSTEQAARWLADVPRYNAPEQWVISSYEGDMVRMSDALAAIARLFAPGDDLVERLQAEKSVISTTRTFPSGDQRDMVLVPNYGPNPLATEAAARISALTATVAELQADLNGPVKPLTDADYANIIAHLSYELEPTGELLNRNSAFMALIHARNEAATLRARLARMEGAITLIAETTENGTIRRIARAALTDGGNNERR